MSYMDFLRFFTDESHYREIPDKMLISLSFVAMQHK